MIAQVLAMISYQVSRSHSLALLGLARTPGGRMSMDRDVVMVSQEATYAVLVLLSLAKLWG